MSLAQAFVNGCFPLGLVWKVCEKGSVCQCWCAPASAIGPGEGTHCSEGAGCERPGPGVLRWMDGPTVTHSHLSCEQQAVC